MRKILGGLLAAAVITVAGAMPASAGISRDAFPRKDNGPGLKNWHCVDPDSSWRGPWRYTKSHAFLDCDSYNSRGND